MRGRIAKEDRDDLWGRRERLFVGGNRNGGHEGEQMENRDVGQGRGLKIDIHER